MRNLDADKYSKTLITHKVDVHAPLSAFDNDLSWVKEQMGFAMYIKKEKGPLFAMTRDGRKISRSDLPPRNTSRWVARRKAAVVSAVESGLIDAKEACEMYSLSSEELDSWISAMEKHGAGALRVTSAQRYRQL